MDRFVPRIVKPAVEAIKPKVNSGPLKRNFSTTDHTRFSDGRSRTPKSDKRNGRVRRDKTSSSTEGVVEEANRRRQVAEALENSATTISESTQGMVVGGVMSLRNRYPGFEKAFQHSLDQGTPTRSDQIEGVAENLGNIESDIGNLERQVKELDVVPLKERPCSKAEEKAWLKKRGFKDKVRVIAYSEECEGHKFNCHGLIVTDGYTGRETPEGLQKFLNKKCDKIGTSDRLDEVQAQKGDILVYQKKRKGTILHSSYASKVKDGEIYKTISTWGRYGVYEHEPTVVPKVYGLYFEIYRPRGGRSKRRFS